MTAWKSKLGIDPEGDAYLDDTEDEIFAGDPGAAAQNYAQAEAKQQHSNKVVNINTTTQLQVVLVKPERFEDASAIADQLNAKRTVVLNLESTGKEVSRRLIDFLSGVAYANDGQIKRVATSTFIITPYNVDIMGDLIDEWRIMAYSSDPAPAARGFIPPQSEEERWLMRRVEELCRVAGSRSIPRYTGFLSDREQVLAQAACHRAGFTSFRFWGGYDGLSAAFCAWNRPTPGRKNRWATCA